VQLEHKSLKLLQQTATDCNMLQHAAAHTYMTCNSIRRGAIGAQVTKITATACNRLQHTAAHYNTIHPTQSIMYVPLQADGFQKIILLIVQYNI